MKARLSRSLAPRIGQVAAALVVVSIAVAMAAAAAVGRTATTPSASQLAIGVKLFTTVGCSACHTFKAASATGKIWSGSRPGQAHNRAADHPDHQGWLRCHDPGGLREVPVQDVALQASVDDRADRRCRGIRGGRSERDSPDSWKLRNGRWLTRLRRDRNDADRHRDDNDDDHAQQDDDDHSHQHGDDARDDDDDQDGWRRRGRRSAGVSAWRDDSDLRPDRRRRRRDRSSTDFDGCL